MKKYRDSPPILDFKVFFFSFFCISLFYLFQTLSNWWLLSITGIRGPYRFLDLKLVLKSFDCFQLDGENVFSAPTGDPCTGYIYGRQFLYLMTKMNIGESASNVLAITFVLFFLIISAAIVAINPSTKKSTLFGFLVFMSPGCWLLIERTNLDLFIFVLLSLAVISIRREAPEIGLILIVMSAFIKFYTFPLAIITIWFIQELNRKVIALLFVSLSGAVLLNEIVKIPTLPGTWYVSFGNQIVTHWWNLLITTKDLNWQSANSLSGSIAGGALVLICSIMCARIFPQSLKIIPMELARGLANRELVALVYLYSTSAFLICYFAGMNYDYRLFYEGITCLVAIKLNPQLDKLLKMLVTTTLISLWCSSFFYTMEGIRVVIIELIGDVFTGISISINVLIVLSLVRIKIRTMKMKDQVDV